MSDNEENLWQEIIADAVPMSNDYQHCIMQGDFDSSALFQFPEGAACSANGYDVSDHIICPLETADKYSGVAFVPRLNGKSVRFSPDRFPAGSFVLGASTAHAPTIIVRDLADGIVLASIGVPCIHVAFTDENVLKVAMDVAKKNGASIVVTHNVYFEGITKPQLFNLDRIGKLPHIQSIVLDEAVSVTPPPTAQDLYDILGIALSGEAQPVPAANLPAPLRKAKQSEVALKSLFTDWTFDLLIDEVPLIYGTRFIWDNMNRIQMELSALRHIVDKDLFKKWDESKSRRKVKGLEFEPGKETSSDMVNLFFGLPERPYQPPEKCKLIIAHINRLCGGRGGEFEWLMKWIAFPIQNLGAKMDSSVIMYGSEGPGKSILWELIVGAIYGEYEITIGQAQLEDQFTGWMSRKMFALCEEVVSRSERNQFKGKLKHLITGKSILVNEKNLPIHKESNHINFVFLSNSTVPLELDFGDRRYLVLHCGGVPPTDYFKELFVEIDGDGVDAFYHYLKSIDLSGFNEHTQPPLNKDKERLIEASMSSTDLFVAEWMRGDSGYPYTSCVKGDLFKAYRRWCTQRNEFIKRDRDLSDSVGKHHGKDDRKDINYPSKLSPKITKRLWISRDDLKLVNEAGYVDKIAANAVIFHNTLIKHIDDEKFNVD